MNVKLTFYDITINIVYPEMRKFGKNGMFGLSDRKTENHF